MDMVSQGQKTPSKTFQVAGNLLVALMLACVVIGVVQAGKAFKPDWHGSYWVAVGILVALDGMTTQRALRQVSFTATQWYLYRASEWVIFALLLKLGYYLVNGLPSLQTDLAALADRVWTGFFSAEFWLGLGVMALVWLLAGQYAAYLWKLEVNEHILHIEQETGIYEKRAEMRQELANLTLVIGLVLVVLFAALRSDFSGVWLANMAPASIGPDSVAPASMVLSGGWHLILYFLLSLALLSLTQYNLLKAGWVRDGIPIGAEVLPRWISASGLLILALGAVALLLPTGYSIGFIQLMQTIVLFLAAIAGFLWFILVSPLFFVMNLFASLFGKSIDVEAPQPPQPLQLPPAAETQAPLPWLELLKSVLVWGLLVVALLFAIVYYLHENQSTLDTLRKASLRVGWGRFWGWLRDWFGRANQAAASAVRASLAAVRARLGRQPDKPVSAYLSLRKLSPREKVFFYYLALLRRAAEKGMAREPAQTPAEYLTTLQQLNEKQPLWSGVDEEQVNHENVDATSWLAHAQELTDSYIQARYSGHHVYSEQASAARQAWERIRRAMRKRW